MDLQRNKQDEIDQRQDTSYSKSLVQRKVWIMSDTFVVSKYSSTVTYSQTDRTQFVEVYHYIRRKHVWSNCKTQYIIFQKKVYRVWPKKKKRKYIEFVQKINKPIICYISMGVGSDSCGYHKIQDILDISKTSVCFWVKYFTVPFNLVFGFM